MNFFRRSSVKKVQEELFYCVLGIEARVKIKQYLSTVRGRLMAGEMLLTREEIDELKQTFIAMDDNGDGMLDNEELAVLFDSLNIACADDDIKAFFSLVDVDDDGTVDYDEFMTMVEHMMELATAGHSYVDMFRMLDREQRGFVSIGELLQSLQNNEVGISLDDVRTILDYDCYVPGDKNRISFTSFRRIVMNELIPECDLLIGDVEIDQLLSDSGQDDSMIRMIRAERAEAKRLSKLAKLAKLGVGDEGEDLAKQEGTELDLKMVVGLLVETASELGKVSSGDVGGLARHEGATMEEVEIENNLPVECKEALVEDKNLQEVEISAEPMPHED
ncbi:uncharacterized protein LOC134814713 [Bolinopsis microptera]|uniref:uncharacterized protein LOC134814713 n=1 Tax=Bolinopsis microptera TaxID=2820187 RepID=UPI00307971EF